MAAVASAYRRVEPARIEQRSVVRHPVVVRRATVRGHGRQPVEAKLVDLSVYGCRLMVDAAYKSGDRLWLRFTGGQPVAATAIWASDNEMGCRFDTPIERDLFRALTLTF